MPDILIRGMEMPKTCSQCPMCYDYMMCKLIHFAFWNTNEPFNCCDERLAGCPLHELPEHGDLVDRSKLSFVCGGTAPMGMDYVQRYVVDGMPVIVPGNKEESE